MKRKKIIISTVIAALFLGALTVVAVVSPNEEVMQLLKGALTPVQFSALMDFRQAHRAELDQRHDQRDNPARLWRELALTEDQQDRLGDVLGMNVDEIAFEAQETQASAAALRRAMFAGVPDSPAIKTASAQFGRDLGDAAVAAAQALADARSLLTPAQVKLLEARIAAHDQHLDQVINEMPARVEEVVALWNTLALTPNQVDALSVIHGRMPGIMRARHEQGREEFRASLAEILTPAQLLLADQFHEDNRPARHERMLEERKLFEAELALSGDQKIKLVNLLIGRREALETAGTLLAAAGLDLRDKALAAPTDEAAIRQSADRLAEIAGYCASLGAEIVTDARRIVSDRQFAVIEKAAAAHDLRANRRIGEVPARVHKTISFLDELNLTPEQKKAIADLVEKKHAERQVEFRKMHRAF